MYYAIINNKIVENVIVWDGVSEWTPPENCEIVPLQPEVGIGWKYENGQFIEPKLDSPN